MTDSRLQLGELLDPRLYDRSRAVQASYVSHVTELGIPALRALGASNQVNLYHCLPWMFSDAVDGLSDDQHEALAVSGLLYFGHLLLVDRMIDRDDEFSAGTLLAANAMHERSLVILAGAGLLSTASAAALRGYTRDYEQAVARERSTTKDVSFGWSDYCTVAKGKAALLKASPALMTLAGGHAELKPTLDEMMDAFNVSAQIHDDIKDWRKDVACGRPGLVMGIAELSQVSRADVSELLTSSDEPLANWLFFEGHAERALAEAATAAARSATLANEIGAARWSKAAQHFADRLSGLNDRLSDTRRTLKARASRDSQVATRRTVRGAVNWLSTQAANEQEPYAHRMLFGQGFNATTPLQSGGVFPRAVMGWSLEVARAAGVSVPQMAREANIRAIWKGRRADELGGWSYFPDLPELPPDADDLGQIALAMGRAPRAKHRQAIAAARSLLLDQHVRADGAIGTWLTDSSADSAVFDRYTSAIARNWGRAHDPEVTANVVFGLAAAGLSLPTDVVQRACDWVASVQGGDGSWKSTWYVGPFYGTYLCLRLLRWRGGYDEQCARAAEFLRAGQRADGGWGAGESDSLSTALAVLGLSQMEDDFESMAAVRRGVGYLTMTQRQTGEWREVPIIQMDLARSFGGPPRILTHGSVLLTTSYALAALTARRTT